MKGCGWRTKAKTDTKTSSLVRHTRHYNIIERFTPLLIICIINYIIIFIFYHAVDETRVILQDGDPNMVGSNYINANYVKVCLELGNKYFINK